LTPQGGIWSEHLIEVDPTNDAIVWEWHAWDHLIDVGVAASSQPTRIDPNAGVKSTEVDWLHINSVRYNAALDQIAVSVHNVNELWIIDHSTTKDEAKSHKGGKQGRGGDLLYRWGNAANYGGSNANLFSGQHDVEWIPDGLPGAGHILIFDNGLSRNYSRVVEIQQPVNADGSYTFVNGTYGPDTLLWEYRASPENSFRAANTSGSQRLPSGNTMITDGPGGRIFEVTTKGDTVWEYFAKATDGQKGQVFRAERYEGTFAGFAGKKLTAGGPVAFAAVGSGGGGKGDGGLKGDGGKGDGGLKGDGGGP
jgi:hypothetical protein